MSGFTTLEISLIDRGLTSLKELKLSPGIINLNVHCNKIQKIENLSHLRALKHLDLSSNKITAFEGLNACTALQTLNLACNSISKVEQLEQLKCLRKLNLSYNIITDISGFASVSKRSHILTHVDLYGNQLSSLKHVTSSLMHCNSILHLRLAKGDDDNPVCQLPAYQPNMFSQLPWLQSLDERNKHGSSVKIETLDLHDIPGLEEYLELLKPDFSDSSFNSLGNSISEQSHGDMPTPRIDSVLNQFVRKSSVLQKELVNSNYGNQDGTSDRIVSDAVDDKHGVNDRLESLEQKLSTLVQIYTENHAQDLGQTRTDDVVVTILPESSSESTSTGSVSVDETPTSQQVSKEPQHQRHQQQSQQQQRQQQQQLQEQPQQSQQHQQKKKQQPTSGIPRQQSNAKNVRYARKVSSSEKSITTKVPESLDRISVQGTKVTSTATRDVRSAKDDETFLSLLNEMDVERERRWKSEQATKKLLENIKILQEKLAEERKIQEAAVTSSAKTKRELNEERSVRTKIEELAHRLEEENGSLKLQLSEITKNEEENKRTIKDLHSTNQKLEKEKIEEGLFNEKRYKELQLDTGGWQRELKLLESTVEKQKTQLTQLQELLISREHEHKNALTGMVSIESKEVRDLISAEVVKCETRNGELSKQKEQMIAQGKQEYSALEDEFRMALQIESNRYNELYSSYQQTAEQLNQVKHAYEELSQKDAKSRTLLTELTALIKEQKARITEMSKSKHDMQIQFKERFEQLENEVVGLRKISARVESLQQDKDRMAAHIRGQESVVQGLRAERKLWGQELAQQGASLAQEKGKTDVQLETQKNEIDNLQNRLKENANTLKIKSKVIEDQTETIKELKGEMAKLAEENKSLAGDSKQEYQTLEKELDNVREQAEELQEHVNALTERKEELKSQLSTSNEDLLQSRDELKQLRSQWDERSKMIDQLQEKVVKMKNTFDEKERKLTTEKNAEAEKLAEIEEKLKTCENRHRSQVVTMKHDFNLELRKVISQKDDEIQSSKEKVMKVEDEMRMLLTETNNQKKNLESRIASLSKAFVDIQNDLT